MVIFATFILSLVLAPNWILSQTLPPRVKTTLTVTNGGPWGDWQQPELCPEGTFAVGFDVKNEYFQFWGDDTAMNGLTLVCADRNGQYDDGGYQVTSGQGPWGGWQELSRCNEVDVQLVAFVLQVEGPVNGDDTSANWIKFQCRHADDAPTELSIHPGWGHAIWGSYGDWSDSCPSGQAICGLRTRIEGEQGRGDDTALNSVELYCCELSEVYTP